MRVADRRLPQPLLTRETQRLVPPSQHPILEDLIDAHVGAEVVRPWEDGRDVGAPCEGEQTHDIRRLVFEVAFEEGEAAVESRWKLGFKEVDALPAKLVHVIYRGDAQDAGEEREEGA